MALTGNESDYEKMKVYAKKRECSVQGAVDLVMPELWLRKKQILNSNMSEKRYKTSKMKDEIDKLPDDSTNVG